MAEAVVDKGWLKLHRSIMDSPSWKCLSPAGKVVMIVILARVSPIESEVLLDGEITKIQPGQCVISIPDIQKDAGPGVSVQNIRTALQYLKVTDFLTDELTKGNRRIITVNNWIIYQSKEPANRQSNRGFNRGSTEGPNRIPKSQGILVSQGSKEDKEVRLIESISLCPISSGNAEDTIYEYFKNHVRAGAKSSALKSIRRILLAEGRSPEEIIQAIDNYVKSNKFPKNQQYRIQANNFFGQARRIDEFWKVEDETGATKKKTPAQIEHDRKVEEAMNHVRTLRP